MIALTGGAGSMGQRLCRHLVDQGKRVRVLDLDKPGTRERMQALGAEFHPCDVSDSGSLEGSLEGCAAVVHLAGLVLADGRSDLLDRVNRQGTENVLQESARAGVGRFVHVSSISVTYRLPNDYAQSKRRAELAVRSSPLDWTILRPTLSWGDPTCAEHEAFRTRVERMAILPLPGGGRARKSPVHVVDLAEAFAATIARSASIGRILSLSGSRTLTLADMAQEILQTNGRKARILPLPSGPLGWMFRVLPPLSRRLGLRPAADWQTYTGLVEDACPSWREAGELLDWHPRPWKATP